MIVPCTRNNWKEPEIGRIVPQRMKFKFIKEVAIQALTKEYFENIGDQVKEIKDDTFHHVTQ
jgi:hypothetical protein